MQTRDQEWGSQEHHGGLLRRGGIGAASWTGRHSAAGHLLIILLLGLRSEDCAQTEES